ncbi:glycosyltransferase [Leptothermofonsia sp. ETS-13]|uniref:glycosyltransferase n=1 Tax=Leptothermofonsia sp. ETS-13 TaxID=3035696 RepID=UPI003B9E7B20
MAIALGLALLSLSIWLVLLLGWGGFWLCDQRLELGTDCSEDSTSQDSMSESRLPSVCAVVPARNEADVLPVSLRSLLVQNYPGNFQIVLVDDHSADGTAQVAKETAEASGKAHLLHLISAEPLPAGWSGKLWAMDQGVQKAQTFSPDYILLTDADIEHDTANLNRLVSKAVKQDLDLVSVMVRLRCESFWEKLLIPAFVFFFMKLYPFRWVNNPARKMAGAAGGCILIRQSALDRIGGLQTIRRALIDDCTLAQRVKGTGNREQETADTEARDGATGRIWLGLSDLTQSLRPYPNLKTIWNMVARTAYTQLNYSPLLLLGTLAGMGLVYLVPPIGLVGGILTGQWAIALISLTTYLLMTLAYFPTVRFYRCPPGFALCLPAIAFLYTLMTLDSAIRHWRGKGGAWKGRVYP